MIKDIEHMFYFRDFYNFLTTNRVMRNITPKALGKPEGRATRLSTSGSQIGLIRTLLGPIEEVGITTGVFGGNKLFDLDRETIKELW